MIKTYYLAYGINLNDWEIGPLCKDARPVGRSFIEDYKLTFRDGLANIEPSEGSRVPVGVWAVSPADMMKLVERCPEYDCTSMEFKKDGFVVSGMVYVLKDGHKLQKPDDDYIARIREGYRVFGLDASYLDDALNAIDE